MDLFIASYYKTDQFEQLYSIIKNSNPDESGEFLSSCVSGNFILILLSLTLVIVLINLALSKLKTKKSKISFAIGGTLVCGGIAVTIFEPTLFDYSFGGKIKKFLNTPEYPDLRKYFQHPDLEYNDEMLPQEVVFIIGESFSRSHSSLYGYSRETNPRLKAMRDTAGMIVFSYPVSAKTHTMAVFETLLNNGGGNVPDNKKWYENLTLAEVVKTAGYDTYWLSNQAKKGFYDSMVTCFSSICDTAVFIGDKYKGIGKSNLDGALISLVRKNLGSPGSHNFYFIHMMGSHGAYSKRYPSDFAQFNADNYSEYNPHQRKMISEYDNSVFYNDWVTASLMHLFDNRDALVIYLSDHGQDLYETKDDYIGHARPGDAASIKVGRHIPLMFYMTPKFRDKNPAAYEYLKSESDKPICTDTIMNVILRVMEIKVKE